MDEADSVLIDDCVNPLIMASAPDDVAKDLFILAQKVCVSDLPPAPTQESPAGSVYLSLTKHYTFSMGPHGMIVRARLEGMMHSLQKCAISHA